MQLEPGTDSTTFYFASVQPPMIEALRLDLEALSAIRYHRLIEPTQSPSPVVISFESDVTVQTNFGGQCETQQGSRGPRFLSLDANRDFFAELGRYAEKQESSSYFI